MTNEFTAWKNWTDEQWLNAVFCDDCGLPLLETEPNEDGISELICAFCNWTDDETNVIHTTVAALRAELAALRKAIQSALDEFPANAKLPLSLRVIEILTDALKEKEE